VKLVLNPEYGLYERGGKAFCSSKQVAETFEKEHRNVLRDIRELDCSEKFSLLNFEQSTYLNEKKQKQPEFLMTKDGFTFLVMGYRGEKAAAFKEIYIERFNQMEDFIKSLLAARFEFPDFTDAVMRSHDEPKFYHYSNELNMINKIVLNMDAKQYKKLHGIAKDEKSIRPFLSAEEAAAIEALQRADIGLLMVVPEFSRRKEILTGLYQRLRAGREAISELSSA